jgi:hypothetical protein
MERDLELTTKIEEVVWTTDVELVFYSSLSPVENPV